MRAGDFEVIRFEARAAVVPVNDAVALCVNRGLPHLFREKIMEGFYRHAVAVSRVAVRIIGFVGFREDSAANFYEDR